MDFVCLTLGHITYPPALTQYLGKDAPSSVAALGNLEALKRNKLGLFCSVKCPGKVILQTHDLARQLIQAGVTVIGGFQSPVERECLRILVRGSQPLIICPARSLKKMRMQKEWRKALDDGRLLFLSPFPDNRHRGDAEMALYRNRFVAALADRIFVPYAAPGSKTEYFCREVGGWGKGLYTFESDIAEGLISLGAKPLALPEASSDLV
ncbi:MAG: DNA-processing protein DprA [Deltaproteobacteria bacterium]|nr:DNA-processing protein DprA [Deltaproteobacteria bacterium]